MLRRVSRMAICVLEATPLVMWAGAPTACMLTFTQAFMVVLLCDHTGVYDLDEAPDCDREGIRLLRWLYRAVASLLQRSSRRLTTRVYESRAMTFSAYICLAFPRWSPSLTRRDAAFTDIQAGKDASRLHVHMYGPGLGEDRTRGRGRGPGDDGERCGHPEGHRWARARGLGQVLEI